MELTTTPNRTPFGTTNTVWRVAPDQSAARFAAAAAWGRIPVTGHLGEIGGTLVWDGTTGRGRLTIATSELSSGINVRDHHLRSRAFFHVRKHPELTFDATDVVPEGDGVRLRGELVVRGRPHQFECLAVAEALEGDRIVLETEAAFDLEELGMSRGLLRMIPAGVSVGVRVVLVPEAE